MQKKFVRKCTHCDTPAIVNGICRVCAEVEAKDLQVSIDAFGIPDCPTHHIPLAQNGNRLMCIKTPCPVNT